MVTTRNLQKKHHVLVVEDDDIMQTIVANFLGQEGYDITGVSTGKGMFAVFNEHSIDLILLDLNLPDEDGLSLARHVRARSSVPIIIITSRTDMDDRLAGLDIGADDFLTKPFDPRELVLRVRNVLRRTNKLDQASHKGIVFGDWIINIAARTLTTSVGEDMALTAGEFNILSALVQAAGRVLSRDNLLDAIIRDDKPPSDRMVDVFISRLRKKIEANTRKPAYIITVPGYGYKFSGAVKLPGKGPQP